MIPVFPVPRGVGPGCNTREIADKLIDLKAELDDLDKREHELDQQRVWVQQSIKNVTDDSQNSPYPLLQSLYLVVTKLIKWVKVHCTLKCFRSVVTNQSTAIDWSIFKSFLVEHLTIL